MQFLNFIIPYIFGNANKPLFQIQIKGEKEMNYKFIEKEAFTVVGKGIRVSMVNGENHRKIPQFWNESNSNGFSAELEKNCGELGLFGVCMDFDQKQDELRISLVPKIIETIYRMIGKRKKFPQPHGQYLNQLGRCLIRFKKCGREFFQNGFLPPVTSLLMPRS
jgi:hypothetical protein